MDKEKERQKEGGGYPKENIVWDGQQLGGGRRA